MENLYSLTEREEKEGEQSKRGKEREMREEHRAEAFAGELPNLQNKKALIS